MSFYPIATFQEVITYTNYINYNILIVVDLPAHSECDCVVAYLGVFNCYAHWLHVWLLLVAFPFILLIFKG